MKNLKELKGATVLSKNEQKAIKGGVFACGSGYQCPKGWRCPIDYTAPTHVECIRIVGGEA